MRSTLAVVGIAFAVLLAVAYFWTREHRDLLNVRQDAEAARLALQHQIVAQEDTKRILNTSVDDLLAKNADLKAALDAAKAAAPGAEVAGSAELRTPLTKSEGPKESAQAVEAKPPAPPAAEEARAACALSQDEQAYVKVDLLGLTTKEKNWLVAGTAEVWAQGADLRDRLVLPPAAFSASVSTADALAPPPAPRWGAEALGMCTARGCGLGAGVLLPPANVLGVRVEARLGALLGPDAAALGAVGLRF